MSTAWWTPTPTRLKLLGGLVGLDGDVSDNWSNLVVRLGHTIRTCCETGHLISFDVTA
ncbi:hypothetical protein GCM10023225_03390 [Kineococcus glutinatus]|uniref:Uncharacterized protein n=1 Tax=Kineococcus glutinatus TaxID=1070872 RepID=A0ABP9H7X8_9ACTN